MDEKELDATLTNFENALVEASEVIEIILEDFNDLDFGKVGRPSYMIGQLESKLSELYSFVEGIEDIIEAIEKHNLKPID